MKYLVKYALSGGFGGCEMVNGEVLDFDSLKNAERYAYECACEEYDSYAGSHGLRDIDNIMDEDEVNEDEAYEIYNEDREGWIDYLVEEIKG